MNMMSSNPIITVLMTVYNGEKYLKQSIKSVLEQTYTDFEFIIVDDCSTDNSLKIINRYKDKRIRIIKNKNNLGQTKSLNIGIELSYGKFIARIDQDDLFDKEKLLKQMELVNKYNYDVIGTRAYGINDKNMKIYTLNHPSKESLIKKSMLIRNPFSHSSLLIKKEKLIKIKKYPENIIVAMDYHLLVDLAIDGCSFFNMPDYLTSIRYHDDNSSTKQKFLLATELILIQKNTISLVTNETLQLFKAMQCYRVIGIFRFLPNNFMKVIRLIINEIKICNFYYLFKIGILSKIFKKNLIYPSGIKKLI